MREFLQTKVKAEAHPPPAAAPDLASSPGGPSRSARGQSAELLEALEGDDVQALAAQGTRGQGQPLPFLDRIQAAFGRHDVAGTQAFAGGEARQANEALGAKAFAQGDKVSFGEAPSLHTAAHEAAHVVQQRAGIHLKSDVGQAGDTHEQHADAVADRVVAGQSAEDLLDRYQGPGAATAGESKSVQMDFLDDAIEAITQWIDLLGPKQALLEKIRDPSWATEAVASFDATAHPDHQEAMLLEVADLADMASLEAQAFADRIADCNALDAVQALDEEFEAWRAQIVTDLAGQMTEVLELYKAEEAAWLESFKSHADISKDPVTFNQSSQKAKLTLATGMQAQTIVETTVSWTFGLTGAATKAKIADWTEAEQKEFKAKFQQQLDDVWGPAAQKFPPFRVTEPKDFLLADAPEKWSDITSNMEAKVSDAPASSAHFKIKALKEDAAENNRSAVGSGGEATFHFADQTAGYDAAGKATGAQHTLAHEWTHMIGNPDEYAENSKAQADLANSPDGTSIGKHQEHHKTTYSNVIKQFDDVIANKDGKYTKAQIDQAKADKNALEHPYDLTPDGRSRNIYELARPNPNRVAEIPDTAFAVRGSYDPAEAEYLRPGAASRRGGTHISKTLKDEQRLSDAGNQVRPYMREGVLVQLNEMLKGQLKPEVQFEHNFKDMSLEDHVDVLDARINALGKDIAALEAKLGTTKVKDESAASPDAVGHSHGDGHDH